MHGLYLLWFVQEQQLPPAIVAAVLAAGDLALIALEIPTGWLADRFGHSLSLVTGSAIQVAGMLWCWLGAGVPGLVIAAVLVAIGDAFRSGADEALLYRTCVAAGRGADFQRIDARARAVEQAALVGLVLAGGVIVHTWGFAAGWLAETLLCLAGLVTALLMTEPPAPGDTGERAPEPRARLAIAPMAALVLPAALLGAAASATSFLVQTTGTASAARMSALVAAIALAEAAGAALAARLPAATLRTQWRLAAVGVAVVSLAVVSPWPFELAVLALSFLEGLAHPLRAAAIQRGAAEGWRATAASAGSACDMLLSTLTLPLAGVWRSRRR